MVRTALVVCLALSQLALAGEPQFPGKKVSLSLKDARVDSLLSMLSSISRVNIVLLDAPARPALDVRVEDQPWHDVLYDVVSRAGLAQWQEGNLVLVGTAERLSERKGQKRKWVGKKVNLFLADASPGDALELLSRVGGSRLRGEGATPLPPLLSLRNMPIDQTVALLLELSGGVLDSKASADAGVDAECAALGSPLESLFVTAITTGTAPYAVVRELDGQTSVVAVQGCVGAQRAKVKSILEDRIITGTHALLLGGKVEPTPSMP